MEHNYRIKGGGLHLCNSTKNKCVAHLSFLYQLCKIILGIGTLFFSMYITLIIYKKCITDITLKECVPLGSIFATFGSAVISVFSIDCSGQSNLFQENLVILREQLFDLHSWQRWPFLKRHIKEKISFLHNNYYILLNPQITFETSTRGLTIPLPSCTADFKDLPVIKNIIKMICFRKYYLNYIYSLHDIKQQEDLYIFDCILMIYKNIIRYKWGTIMIWIGAEFIFSSVLFSFFYEQIMCFLQYLATYF